MVMAPLLDAARRGRVDECREALRASPVADPDPGVYAEAAAGGHADVLQWAAEEAGIPLPGPTHWAEGVCLPAAAAGHLAALRWAIAQPPAGPPVAQAVLQACTEAAASAGRLDVVQWFFLHHRAELCEAEVLMRACLEARWPVMEWLVLIADCRTGLRVGCEVARKGSLDVLRWLRAHDKLPWDEYTSIEGSQNDDPAVERWLAAGGCPSFVRRDDRLNG